MKVMRWMCTITSSNGSAARSSSRISGSHLVGFYPTTRWITLGSRRRIRLPRRNYVPSAQDALIMFNKFLRRTAKSPSIVRDFIEVPRNGSANIAPFPAEERAKLFAFDNVAGEVVQTSAIVQQLQRSMTRSSSSSSVQADRPVWLSNGKLLSYATNADTEFVQVAPGSDQGLLASLQGLNQRRGVEPVIVSQTRSTPALFNAFLRRTMPLLENSTAMCWRSHLSPKSHATNVPRTRVNARSSPS